MLRIEVWPSHEWRGSVITVIEGDLLGYGLTVEEGRIIIHEKGNQWQKKCIRT
jgi:hypothetical protein